MARHLLGTIHDQGRQGTGEALTRVIGLDIVIHRGTETVTAMATVSAPARANGGPGWALRKIPQLSAGTACPASNTRRRARHVL